LIFVFFFVDLFDNVGTLVGVCEQGGFLRDGKLPRASRALLADAFGTITGALSGTSTVTSYIESAAGVAAGGRTGLGNVLIAVLFVGAMFCAPLVAAVPGYATAPALIFGRRTAVRFHRAREMGRLHRSISRVPDRRRHAAHLQHRDGTEPGPSVLYLSQSWFRTIQRDQSADLDSLRTFPLPLRIPR